MSQSMMNISFSQNRGEGQARAARGRLVAQLLSEAWRGSPPQPLNSARELEEIAPLLLKSGAGGLAWCRVRKTPLRTSRAASHFRQAYRLHSLQAALHERSLKQVIRILRGAGVEPVLVKGWAIARLYPEPGMRPYGDLDLCVSPDHYATARKALESVESEGHNVDLHLGFGEFYDRQGDDVFARSHLVSLDDQEIRVLSPEDHLRFLCIHLLRHGVVRPLWLCDIAVLLEGRTSDFDWDHCLSGSRQQADWVACAVGLAHQLLGVVVEDTPIARRAQNLPGWLVPAVLHEWGVPFQFRGEVAVYLRHPIKLLRGLPAELPRHWPNAIEATMTMRSSFNELPRLPFQVGHVFVRATSLFAQLSQLLRMSANRGV